MHSTPTKVLQNYNNRNVRLRHKTQPDHTQGAVISNTCLTASPQVQGYTKLNSSAHPSQTHPKLNTTALSQLNPQLTPEQKFSRTINHVEKWLTERDQVLAKTNNTEPTKKVEAEAAASRSTKIRDIAKDEKNLDNLINTKLFVEKLKMTEKYTEKFAVDSPAKKTFNKEVLLGPRKAKSLRAAAGVVPTVTKSAPAESESKSSRSQALVEYGSVPITGDPSECENLLRASCTDDSSCSQAEGETTTSTAVHRYVHEHIHHHYHHFENTGEVI